MTIFDVLTLIGGDSQDYQDKYKNYLGKYSFEK